MTWSMVQKLIDADDSIESLLKEPGFWESEEAIRAFAGNDISVAKYYDFDKHFLLEMEPSSTHYEMYDQ